MREINKPEQMASFDVKPAPELLRESEVKQRDWASNLDSSFAECEIGSVDSFDALENHFAQNQQDFDPRNFLKNEAIDNTSSPMTEQEAFNQLFDYMNRHQYGPGDFDVYSQDPEWRKLQKCAFPDYELPPLHNNTTNNINEVSIQRVEDIKGWIRDINPNYDPDNWTSPYCNNCGSCALAVEQRFNGSTYSVASSKNIGTVTEMNAITGMEQIHMTPQEIRNFLISQGPGSHGIVGVDREFGAGHWFNAYYDGKEVVAIDGQSGEIYRWPPDYGNVVYWDFSVKKGAVC